MSGELNWTATENLSVLDWSVEMEGSKVITGIAETFLMPQGS